MKRDWTEVIRYALVGAVSNLLLYVVYLILGDLAMMAPSAAMTTTYVLGVLASFLMHRRLTFRVTGKVSRPFFRFVLAHIVGYLLNLSLLAWLVDQLGYPHQVVQGGAIFIVAFVLFLLFKYFVFANNSIESNKPRNSKVIT